MPDDDVREDKGRGTLRPKDAHGGGSAIKRVWGLTNDTREGTRHRRPQPSDAHLDSFENERVGERPTEPTEGTAAQSQMK